ncbi:hypothetical protein GW796_00460 [archaeon]|nr:hypothetical protein [archaeon]
MNSDILSNGIVINLDRVFINQVCDISLSYQTDNLIKSSDSNNQYFFNIASASDN